MFLAAALALGGNTAAGQERGDEATSDGQIEEIVISAPWMARREVVERRTSTGARIEEITLTRSVDYSDLELERTEDARELERRIEDVARQSCEVLADEFPLADTDTQSCVESARRDAMAQARQAIDAAIGQDVAAADEEG